MRDKHQNDYTEFYIPPDRVIEEMIVNSALRDRRVFLNGKVDEDSIFKAVYLLDRIMTIDKLAGKKEFENVEVVINSPGGYIYHGLSLISKLEEMKSLGYHIITTVHSIAMSMGFMILIVGSERRAMLHSRIMCHQPSSGTWGTLQEMEDDVEETKALWDRLKQIIIKYTKIADIQLEEIKMKKQDKFLWAEEALKLGVIDSIIGG